MKLLFFVMLSFLVSCAHSPFYDHHAHNNYAGQAATDAANAASQASQAASMPMMMP